MRHHDKMPSTVPSWRLRAVAAVLVLCALVLSAAASCADDVARAGNSTHSEWDDLSKYLDDLNALGRSAPESFYVNTVEAMGTNPTFYRML